MEKRRVPQIFIMLGSTGTLINAYQALAQWAQRNCWAM